MNRHSIHELIEDQFIIILECALKFHEIQRSRLDRIDEEAKAKAEAEQLHIVQRQQALAVLQADVLAAEVQTASGAHYATAPSKPAKRRLRQNRITAKKSC